MNTPNLCIKNIIILHIKYDGYGLLSIFSHGVERFCRNEKPGDTFRKGVSGFFISSF